MFVFGGEGNPVSITGTFPHTESYDFATGTWRREENMPTPRPGIGAATASGIIHVPGGAPVQGFGITDVHEGFGVLPRRRIVLSR